MASPDDINSTLKGIVTNISQEASAIGALGTTAVSSLVVMQNILSAVQNIATAIYSTFPRIVGTFTLVATADPGPTFFITEPRIVANGFPVLMPMTEDAGILITKVLWCASVTGGSGFTLGADSTTSGNETFSYVIFNPA